ncbi:MAG: hypothetical protein ACE5HS_21245 [bacterium]
MQKSETVLYKINPKNGVSKVHTFDSWSGNYAFQMKSFFYDVYPGMGEAIWLASGFGLVKFDRDDAQFTQYQHDPADSTSLSHNQVKAICPHPFQPRRYLPLAGHRRRRTESIRPR